MVFYINFSFRFSFFAYIIVFASPCVFRQLYITFQHADSMKIDNLHLHTKKKTFMHNQAITMYV